MLRSDQILATVEMIQKENLDVRTVTMGISLLDCRGGDVEETCKRIHNRIIDYAGNFVATCDTISRKYGIPVVNKRIAVTPIAFVGAGFFREDFVRIAQTLDQAAKAVGVDILGGFSAQVEKGMTNTDLEFIAAIPEALAQTERVCSSINIGSTQKGINMDALAMMGRTIKELAEKTADQGGFAAAKFVVFCNQPGDNPFMAGAIHGLEEADAVLNVGVSGPGVIARALERLIEKHPEPGSLRLDELAEEMCRQRRVTPAFKGYRGYPRSICVSVNEEVVHGIPGPRRLKAGDLVSLDFGVKYEGFYGDAAITVGVGDVGAKARALIATTEESLYAGIAQVKAG